MHIPDGVVSIPVAAATYAGSVGALAFAVRRTRDTLQERLVPLMGVMGAFVFAAQMINFKVAAGTSGHLLGGALLAILLGPWAGSLVLTAVLLVQALIFQDGGLIALGANVFNMAIVGVWSGYAIYRLLDRLLPAGRLTWLSGFASAWASVMIASALAGVELAISGMAPMRVVLPGMLGVHALIGVGEGLITTGVLTFLGATRKDLLARSHAKAGGVQ